MAVISGATTAVLAASSADLNSFLSQTSHPSYSSTELILSLWGLEGNEEPAATSECRWAVGATASTVLTLIRDTGNTTSNTDVRLLVHGMVNPAVDPVGGTRVTWQFTAQPVCSIFVNVSGVNTASVAAATNFIDEAIIVDASTSATLSSGGSSGNDLLVFAVAQDVAMGPPTVTGFTTVVQGATGATASDIYYYVGHLAAGAPGGASVDWASSNESTAVLIELVNAGGSTINVLRRRMM